MLAYKLGQKYIATTKQNLINDVHGEDGHVQWWQCAPSLAGWVLGCEELVLPHYLPYVSGKDSTCCKTWGVME